MKRSLDSMFRFRLAEWIPRGRYLKKERKKVRIMKNVFDAILETGHDEDFVPIVTEDFRPTDAPAGSPAKLEVLAERIRKGLPLWHPEDRVDYAGLTGAVRPRD